MLNPPEGAMVVRAPAKANPPGAPERFLIVPDDYQAELAGKTKDGTQVFITRTFTLEKEILAAFLWTSEGEFQEAWLHDLGPRPTDPKDEKKKIKLIEKALGRLKRRAIEVAPFEIEAWGIEIGLVFSRDEECGDWISLLPGDCMAFMPPWDGAYDT